MEKKNKPELSGESLDQQPVEGDLRTALDEAGHIADQQQVLPEQILAADITVHSAQELDADIPNACILTRPERDPEPRDPMMDEFILWQTRPLDSCYPIVFFDSIRLNIREGGLIKNKAAYFAMGVRVSGHRQVLGLWIEQEEGAEFWARVMSDIRNRGTQDILIVVMDGLKSFPEAITAVFPNTVVQSCILHLIRYSMQLAASFQRTQITDALRAVYWANSHEGAAVALAYFELDVWGRKYPEIAQSWWSHWEAVIPFFALPAEVRKVIYSTSAIHSLNTYVRRAVRNNEHFSSAQAATIAIWRRLRTIAENWRNPPISWRAAQAELAMHFEDRFVPSEPPPAQAEYL
jgi:putative transposase